MPSEQYPFLRYLTYRSQGDLTATGTQSYFFFWARNGIYYSLRALGLRPGVHVLLPAYLCTAAVEPFINFGAEVEFYGIRRDLKPDFKEIESRIGPNTGAVLAVHYFGFPQEISTFRDLCNRHQIALIEDCAHVLCGEFEGRPLGSFGDASVFSWRKFLPLYDGGELRLNRESAALSVPWKKETILFTLKVTKCLLDRTLEQSSGLFARELSRALGFAREMWKRANGKTADQPVLALDSSAPSFDPSLLTHPMSRVSAWLMRRSSVAHITKQRRENFLFLQRALLEVKGIQMLHPELPTNVCPWVFPLVFDSLSNAHLLLRQKGIPAVTWGAVRPPSLDVKQFKDADFLYENLVFLPVHQNLDRKALTQIVAAVAALARHHLSGKSAEFCAVG